MDDRDDVPSWVCRELAGLFDAVPEALAPLPEAAGFPRTLDAIRALQAAFAARPREVHQAEHARLFVNAPEGVAAPPYASWYLDGRLLGPAADWVAGEYRRQALELAPDAGQPADFIGTELEYLYFLGRHQRAARWTRDVAGFEATGVAEARMLDHLRRWTPLFLADVRRAAADGLYGRAADVLQTYLVEQSCRPGEPS